jgi:acyl-CoA ligase (AMP-forming) (exosortase A-associated)
MYLVHDLIDGSAARFSARIALRYRGKSLSYEALRQLTLRTAAGLQQLGVRPGDRVVMQLANRLEAVEVFFACSRIGAICVPVNPSLKSRQLQHVLKDSGARVFVASTPEFSLGGPVLEECPALAMMISVDAAEAEPGAVSIPIHPLRHLRTMADEPIPVHPIDEDVAALLYTSGSTGRPKGVVLSHRNLYSGAESVAQYLGNVPEDRILAALPLSFDYGFNQVSTAFLVGACAVLTNYSTSAALLSDIEKEKITGLAGVPTMWAHLAAASWPAQCGENLRYITNSGGVLHRPIIDALAKHLPKTRIFCMYGLTEAFRSTYLDPALLHERPGSIGKAVPNQEVLVLRRDGSPCEPNEVGELVHRGSFVSLGYWNDPETTQLRFRPLPPRTDGSYRREMAVWSGDLVRRDDDGFLYFVERADRQIKTSGMRVSPSEVEEAVIEVQGVIEAVAFGRPDDVLGQAIVVAVVCVAGAAADVERRIHDHCRMQLPSYMMPAEVRILEQLPRTPNGKPDRARIAEDLRRVA